MGGNIGPRTAAQIAHLNSPWFRLRRLEGLRKANALWRERPRCGANAKHSGEPCQKPALANGRCRYHGGAVPKGREWHKVQLANASKSDEKLAKKLRELERRRKQIAQRVAAMTDQERERYAAWHASHHPGGPTARHRARANREARDFLARLEKQDKAPTGATDLQAEIAACKALLARLTVPGSAD